MYGNFCGPYWSDGKFQASVEPTIDAVDDLDETCREHDAAYARGGDLRAADLKFFRQNFGKGFLHTAMAIPVGIQGYLRADDKVQPKQIKTPNSQQMTKKNLRGAAAKPKSQQNDKRSMAPVAIATKRVGAAPKMTTKPSGSVEIAHRAFLGPVTCNGAFSATAYPVNPGLPGTFPWLSKVARRYEEYRFKKLRFEYRSVCATSTSGVVMLSFDYDAADPPPSNKAAQAQSIPNSEVNCWASNDLAVTMDNAYKYVRAGNLPPNLDVKTYDAGQMFLSTVYGSNIVTGELYVEYVVELRKPTDGPVTGGQQRWTSTSFAAPMGGPLVLNTGFLPYTVTSNTDITFTSPGEFVINIYSTGTGITLAPVAPVISSVSGGVVGPLMANYSSNLGNRMVKVRASAGDVLTFTNAGAGTTLTAFWLVTSVADYDTLS
nr:structural protein [Tolivirales sp.]